MTKCCEIKEARLKYNRDFKAREDVELGQKPTTDKNDGDDNQANLVGTTSKYERTVFYGRPVNSVIPTTAEENIELVSVHHDSTDV